MLPLQITGYETLLAHSTTCLRAKVCGRGQVHESYNCCNHFIRFYMCSYIVAIIDTEVGFYKRLFVRTLFIGDLAAWRCKPFFRGG